jgi:hypothetical protein
VIIHRSHPESQFVQIPNETIRDRRLSYLARGVLAELLSRPDNWQTSADALWRRGRSERGSAGEGRSVVRAAFTELEAAGYLYRARTRGERGRFVTVLHVFDAPDGQAAWRAAAGFLSLPAGNPPPEDVSAGRTDDGTGGVRCDLGEHASSQAAPAYRPPGVGGPGVGGPGARQPGVSTKTDDGDLSTKTGDENQDDENARSGMQSPVSVEGNGAAPGQDPGYLEFKAARARGEIP